MNLISQGGLAQLVERSICIREAPGSIPGFSISLFFLANYIFVGILSVIFMAMETVNAPV